MVWVYHKGKARGMTPVPPEKWSSTEEVEQMLGSHDPNVRGRATEELVQQKRAGAGNEVLDALRDSDHHRSQGATPLGAWS